MRWFTIAVLFTTACDAGEVDGPTTTGFVRETVAGGQFKPLAGYQGIGGQGYMTRLPGQTELYMAVSGLKGDTMYTAHLHVAPCAAGAGGHYKIDASNPVTVEANELWLKGKSTRAGTVFAIADFPHVTRNDAKSIVVHDPANGAKMACADLVPM